MGERRGGMRYNVGEYGKKIKRQDSKNRRAGGVRFLVKEFFCDIIEVIEDRKCDKSIWLRVAGEKGAKYFFVGNIYMPPESKSTVKETQKKFGEIAVDLQQHKRRISISGRFEFKHREGK